jgi:hypothetical protein
VAAGDSCRESTGHLAFHDSAVPVLSAVRRGDHVQFDDFPGRDQYLAGPESDALRFLVLHHEFRSLPHGDLSARLGQGHLGDLHVHHSGAVVVNVPARLLAQPLIREPGGNGRWPDLGSWRPSVVCWLPAGLSAGFGKLPKCQLVEPRARRGPKTAGPWNLGALLHDVRPLALVALPASLPIAQCLHGHRGHLDGIPGRSGEPSIPIFHWSC